MDERKYLILISGKNRTSELFSCKYNTDLHSYEVEFNGSNKKYTYRAQNIEFLKKPDVLNPHQYQISLNNCVLESIDGIYVFRGNNEWWHIVYKSNKSITRMKRDLVITEKVFTDEEANNKLNYLREMAAFSDLKGDHGERLLEKQYAKLKEVRKDSALALYLNPQKSIMKNHEHKLFIFPFGGNASQFKAVENAMKNQISVIQGPPGTGKTQTILNIIANLLIENKSVQIVSNNNSAVKNVLEKLSSPQYELDFLVAYLGKKENKVEFINSQTGIYPDLSSWKRGPEELKGLKESIFANTQIVSSFFEKQEQLAQKKQKLSALELEFKYYERFCKEHNLVWPRKNPRKSIQAATMLRIIHSLERGCEQNSIRLAWQKAVNVFYHGLYEWKYNKQKVTSIIFYLQFLFYHSKMQELQKEIDMLQHELDSEDTKGKMKQLTEQSLEYLKGILFERFGKKEKRECFTEESLWRSGQKVLEEYPIILSTTFSSYSCLDDAHYDYVIMDEASQVDIATGALALANGENTVVVGDLKQLSNIVNGDIKKKSKAVFNTYSLEQGYSFSENSFLESICSVIPDLPEVLLREHYRCHPKIIGFCNQKFYDNRLIIMTEDKGEKDVISVYRTVVGNHCRERLNQRQIDVTTKEILPNIGQEYNTEIGIIAPYRDQVKELALSVKNDVEVDTVHKFQGREKEVIILNTVDDKVTSFSDDLSLINVAISRAKKKFYLVVSGNEQPVDSNIRDLIAYIEYNNFKISDSKVYSVFDMLYQQYTEERMTFLKKHKKVSEYDSENLMHGAIVDLLKEMKGLPLKVSCHQKLSLVAKGSSEFTARESEYINNPNTHIDFLIYNYLRKEPVLAVEVDGFYYHQEGTLQFERDKLKKTILEKCGIPLLRLPTNGSEEIEKIRRMLLGSK